MNEAAVRKDERLRCARYLEETLVIMRDLAAGTPELDGILSVTEGHILDLRAWDGVLAAEAMGVVFQ